MRHTMHKQAVCVGAIFFANQPMDCKIIKYVNRGLLNFHLVAQPHYPFLKAHMERECDLLARETDIHVPAYRKSFSPAQWARKGMAAKQPGIRIQTGCGSFGYNRNITNASNVTN